MERIQGCNTSVRQLRGTALLKADSFSKFVMSYIYVSLSACAGRLRYTIC